MLLWIPYGAEIYDGYVGTFQGRQLGDDLLAIAELCGRKMTETITSLINIIHSIKLYEGVSTIETIITSG